MEKLPLHPEYAKAPPIDKANNKKVSYFSRVLIVHVGDFSCIKKHTIEVKGAGGKCFFEILRGSWHRIFLG